MATCFKTGLSTSYAYKSRHCRCDDCLRWKKDAAVRTNDKQRAAQRSREWRLKNLKRSRDNAKRWQAQNPDKVLAMNLRKYELTVEQYNIFLKRQHGKCAICGDLPSPGKMANTKTRLCVDHDRATGKVRGLLCGACNVGIGHLQHDSNLLKQAIRYLEGTAHKKEPAFKERTDIKENGDVY